MVKNAKKSALYSDVYTVEEFAKIFKLSPKPSETSSAAVKYPLSASENNIAFLRSWSTVILLKPSRLKKEDSGCGSAIASQA